MNQKHLLWHVFNMMEGMDIDVSDFIEAISVSKVRFSDNPLPGEITPAAALAERYEAYKKAVIR